MVTSKEARTTVFVRLTKQRWSCRQTRSGKVTFNKDRRAQLTCGAFVLHTSCLDHGLRNIREILCSFSPSDDMMMLQRRKPPVDGTMARSLRRVHQGARSSGGAFIRGRVHQGARSSGGAFIRGRVHQGARSSGGAFIRGRVHQGARSSGGAFIRGRVHQGARSSGGAFIRGRVHQGARSSPSRLLSFRFYCFPVEENTETVVCRIESLQSSLLDSTTDVAACGQDLQKAKP